MVIALRSALFISLIFSASACKGTNMETYNREQVEIVDLVLREDGARILQFRVPLETAWYCPGLVVDQSDRGTEISVVRCRLRQTCDVTHPVNPQDPIYEVTLPGGASPVFIRDSEGFFEIAPQ